MCQRWTNGNLAAVPPEVVVSIVARKASGKAGNSAAWNAWRPSHFVCSVFDDSFGR